MKIVIATDSLKGSLSSLEAGNAIRHGIRNVYPRSEILVRPLADGGEGTVEALTTGMGGQLRTISVTGPLGSKVDCTYGILADGSTAVIEMSAAAGITLVPPSERNPLYTTTFGVGEVICDAIRQGCRSFIVGIGGSATNDGGAGMLQALGYDLLDAEGKPIAAGAIGLKTLASVSSGHVIPELAECRFRIACDVKNPLCGANGCSAIYGPQKGATPEMIQEMDQWLGRYADLAHSISEKADAEVPGTGAAGGMGFAFLSFTNAELEPGIQIVLEETHLEDWLRDADFVITGEGRLDAQTVMGKAPIGVAALAKKHFCRVIAFAGCVTPDAELCNSHGIDAFFPILRSAVSLEEAMNPDTAAANLSAAAEQVFRLIHSAEEVF